LRFEARVGWRPDERHLALNDTILELRHIDLHRANGAHRVDHVPRPVHLDGLGKHLGLSRPLEPTGQLAVQEDLDRELTDGARHPLENQGGRNHLHHRHAGRKIEHLLFEVVARLFLRLELHIDRRKALLPDRIEPGPAPLEAHTNLVGDLGDEDHVLGVRRWLHDDVNVDVSLHVFRTVHQRKHEDRDAEGTGLEPEVLGEEEPDGGKRVDDGAHDVSSAFLTVITASEL
jgi:hypothetical protein